MKWMFIVAGLMAAGTAIVLLGIWSRKNKAPKGEVSMMACVKRIFQLENGAMAGVFLVRGQELKFALPGHIARQLKPGERGVLTYRGNEFVYFVPRQQMFETDGEGALPAVS